MAQFSVADFIRANTPMGTSGQPRGGPDGLGAEWGLGDYPGWESWTPEKQYTTFLGPLEMAGTNSPYGYLGNGMMEVRDQSLATNIDAANAGPLGLDKDFWSGASIFALPFAAAGISGALAGTAAGGAGTAAGAGGAMDMGVGLGGWMDALGASASGAGAAGGSALGGTQGGGMWDYLDQLIGNFGDSGAENMFGFEGGGTLMPPAVPETAQQLTEWGLTETAPGRWSLPALPGQSLSFQDAIRYANSIRQLGSAAGLGGLGGLGGASSGSGILGQLSNDPLGSAFNATPFLLAAYQANNQRNDIQPYLDQINQAGSALNPAAYAKSLTDPYDLATIQQRSALSQDLSNRGVAGSSFGNMDLNNFDYTHGLGRADILSRGLQTGAGLTTQNAQAGAGMVNTRNLGSNALLGAGLAASGSLFKPNDPTGQIAWLQALMGNGG